jgi:hypothetical protein
MSDCPVSDSSGGCSSEDGLRNKRSTSTPRFPQIFQNCCLTRNLGLGLLAGAILLMGAQVKLWAQQSSSDWPQSNNNQDQTYSPQSDSPQPYSPDQNGANQQQPYADSGQPYSQTDPQNGPVRQPLGSGQLEQLVAPIALYPDALVAQILAASTYPQQVMEADRWRQGQGYATPDQIVYAANTQNWDPSVKALTAFPQVLSQMDRNLRWTTDLGNAYYNQPQDVLEAVQVMRRRAQAAGNLQSTPQEVVQYDQGNIELQPANPQVVYVPTYNPWTVYGEAVAPYPGFSLLGAIGGLIAGPIRYGMGIALSAFMHSPWGWLAWGLDWLGHALLFHHSDYYSHSRSVADWGFPHHGFHAYAGRAGFAREHEFGRMRDEGWRHAGYVSGGWHGFARGPDRPREDRRAENFGERSMRENSRASESFRDDRRAMGRYDSRSAGRMPENRGTQFAFNHGAGYEARMTGRFGGGQPAYREPMNGFNRAGSGSDGFGERSSGAFSRSSAKPAHSGGFHLFGGGHSEKGFRGSHGFSGGHASKSFGGSKGFDGGKSFGSGKSFGGGHSHGVGGHGGGGKHHR